MDGIDEADLAAIEREHHRLRPHSFAEEAHAAQQAAGGDAGAGENDVVAGREFVCVVNAARIFDAHLRDAFEMLRLLHDQAAENLAVEAAQSSGGEHAFGRAADAHHGVDAGAAHSRADAGGKIAVGDQLNARADFANFGDQIFVPRAVHHYDYEIFHAALETLR